MRNLVVPGNINVLHEVGHIYVVTIPNSGLESNGIQFSVMYHVFKQANM